MADHFTAHGREVGAGTVEQFDASAQDTLLVGTYFEFYSETAGVDRIGCFDRATGRFVILNLNDQIVSHYVTQVGYIRGLPENNYDG